MRNIFDKMRICAIFLKKYFWLIAVFLKMNFVFRNDTQSICSYLRELPTKARVPTNPPSV